MMNSTKGGFRELALRCSRGERPGRSVGTPGKFLSPAELDRLIKVSAFAPVRERVAIHLALGTGLRVGEISRLCCGDITGTDEWSVLKVTQGKGGKARMVWFNGDLKKQLAQYLDWKRQQGEGTAPGDPLIKSLVSGGAAAKRTLQRAWSRLAQRAGITGHSFHHLRHTYASHLYRASNYNLRLVQKQLGHANIKTTQIYADVFDEDLKNALERLYQ